MNNLNSLNKYYKGIHLYVNLKNLNAVIKREELKSDNLARVFHAVDNFVSSAESFINTYNDLVYVEKLTNSRLHVVFYDGQDIASHFAEVVFFMYELVNKLNKDSKYNQLLAFNASMGADYGYFKEFDFQADNENKYIEYNSIGYPANRAAKLEAVADDWELLMSKEVLNVVSSRFGSKLNYAIKDKLDRIYVKYSGMTVFSFSNFSDIVTSRLYDSKFNVANEKYKSNLEKRFGDINFTYARKQIDFDNLSLLSPKKTESVVIYADIRGFTKKFNSDGSNLDNMSKLTKEVLSVMYSAVIRKDGSHIQFQGDRESALRNDFGDIDYVLKGLQVAMFILEKVKQNSVSKDNNLHIGIGCSFGKVYAARIGIRNHKHNLIIGETVKQANDAEDLIAGEDEIAIRTDMFNHLLDCEKGEYRAIIRDIFIKRDENHYVTKYTFTEFNNKLNQKIQENNKEYAKKMKHKSLGMTTIFKTRTKFRTELYKEIEDISQVNYIEYLSDFIEAFHGVKDLFPGLVVNMYPFSNPCKSITISGILIAKEMIDLMSLTDVEEFSQYGLQIFAVVPENFKKIGIYVFDSYNVIDFDAIPYDLRHYRYTPKKTRVICTHREDKIKTNNPIISVLLSAWTLFVEYKRFEQNGKFELECLPHGK